MKKYDSLGDRMKGYENVYRNKLPKNTNIIIRLDGKAFHTYTRGMEQPYDAYFINAMNEAAKYVTSKIQGAKFAYVQSDEISIILTDYDDEKSEAYFDGNIQKIASVTASLCTTAFNKIMWKKYPEKDAHFDSRVFSIDSQMEAYNYFLFRQRDCQRNSRLSFGQYHLSKKRCHGLKTDELIKKVLEETGNDWNMLSNGLKNGRIIYNEKYLKDTVLRKRWVVKEAEKFTPTTIIGHLPYKSQAARNLEKITGLDILKFHGRLEEFSDQIQETGKLLYQSQPTVDGVETFKHLGSMNTYNVYLGSDVNKIMVDEIAHEK